MTGPAVTHVPGQEAPPEEDRLSPPRSWRLCVPLRWRRPQLPRPLPWTLPHAMTDGPPVYRVVRDDLESAPSPGACLLALGTEEGLYFLTPDAEHLHFAGRATPRFEEAFRVFASSEEARHAGAGLGQARDWLILEATVEGRSVRLDAVAPLVMPAARRWKRRQEDTKVYAARHLFLHPEEWLELAQDPGGYVQGVVARYAPLTAPDALRLLAASPDRYVQQTLQWRREVCREALPGPEGSAEAFDFEGTCAGCGASSGALSRGNLCRSCAAGEWPVDAPWDGPLPEDR